MEPREWMLSKEERGNRQTVLDDRHPGDEAWSSGNVVRPLIHGATYFAELYERIEATKAGDIVYFTDWQGDADERLTGEPGSEVVDVLARADERGVDVRGLIWRSHWDKLHFAAEQNRTLGENLQKRGAEALLDMRVRTGGSHHQKFVVIRHRGDSSRDIAFVGGIDLCHSRRDTIEHRGDPQALGMAAEYGKTPPWHDIQVAIQGPAVHDVETVFRERWLDPTRLTRHPVYWTQDKLKRLDTEPDPLPEQQPPPPSPEGASHVVQLLRTYPNLRHGRDYPFARGGERSVARGYTKALVKAQRLIYIEDQYLWGRDVGDLFTGALKENPDLHVIAVLPRYTDQSSALARGPQMLGRAIAMKEMHDVAPNRVFLYSIENHDSMPVYVHAKTCNIDDIWCSVGSDNFNRRSWTHDSELSAVVMEPSGGDHSPYARSLRLTLAAEHLDRDISGCSTYEELLHVMDDCVEPMGMVQQFAESAARLEEWHQGGRKGERPPGRLRPMGTPEIPTVRRGLVTPLLSVLHDPDGRPGALKHRDKF